MSVESAKKFLERFQSDPEFKKKLATASAEERLKAIKAGGYDFTPEEMEQLELPDEVLDTIAGGCSYCDMDGG